MIDCQPSQMEILSSSRKGWWKSTYTGTIYRLKEGEIVCDDAHRFLNSLKDKCADIIFLDPPFNLGKKYGKRTRKDDALEEGKYLGYMTQVLLRSKEILKAGGALYLYHLPKWAIRFAGILQKELNFRHWIAVSMKNGFVRSRYLYPAHYALLYFTKGDPAHFVRPKLSIDRCRKCGTAIKDYGGYKEFVQNGLNLSDFWEDISPVRHKKFKHRPSNELPIRMLSRVMEISGVRGGLAVDPFAGTGTTLSAAKKAGMRFVACDIEEESLNIAINRLAHPE